MNGETIRVPAGDSAVEAYVARPDDGEHPAVLFYIDAIGLRPRTQEMADRIASWGYVVLVPNIFYRDGTAEELAPTEDLTIAANREAFFVGAMQRVRAHTAEQSDADLDAYLAAIGDLPGVASGPVGVTGYCVGGRLSIRAAGLRPDVVAAAGAFHAGGLVTDAEDSPHRLVTSATARIVAGHADQDTSNPAEAVAAFEAALDSAGLAYRSAIYPGAPHGYTMSDTSMYDEAGTERHFRELEELLAETIAN